MFYTPILGYENDNKNNVIASKTLIQKNEEKIDPSIRFPYFRNISNIDILEFLKKLEINTDLNDNFDTDQLSKFIKEADLQFDVLIMGGKGDEVDFARGIKIKPIIRKYDIVSGMPFLRINRHRLGGNRDTAFGLKKEVVQQIDSENEGVDEKNYLIKERNPLLIIYAVKPSNTTINEDNLMDDEDEINAIIALKDIEKRKEEMKFEKSLESQNPSYLMGFQMGFPKRGLTTGSSQRYYTNIKADYFKLFGGENEDEEDEGDEV